MLLHPHARDDTKRAGLANVKDDILDGEWGITAHPDDLEELYVGGVHSLVSELVGARLEEIEPAQQDAALRMLLTSDHTDTESVLGILKAATYL